MYFPYLYGLTAESRALRDLAGDLAADGMVEPLIDPVQGLTPTLRQALAAIEAARLPAWLIMNPSSRQIGGLCGRHQQDDTIAALAGGTATALLRPTLLLHAQLAPAQVERFDATHRGREVGLVACPGGPALDTVMALLGGVRVARVFFQDQAPSVAAIATVGAARCVWVERHRLDQPRAMLAGGRAQRWVIDRQFFSDALWRYRETGFGGFSDYTSAPSRAPWGAEPLVASAFHLTCLRAGVGGQTELWVEYFSDQARRSGSTTYPGRFLDALEGFRLAQTRDDAGFGPTRAALRYMDCLLASHAASRGLSQQWQLMHHLELTSGLLAGRFAAAPAAAPRLRASPRSVAPPPR